MVDYEIYQECFFFIKSKKIINSFFKSLKKQSTLVCKEQEKECPIVINLHGIFPLNFYNKTFHALIINNLHRVIAKLF